jgi:hypothetical protein
MVTDNPGNPSMTEVSPNIDDLLLQEIYSLREKLTIAVEAIKSYEPGFDGIEFMHRLSAVDYEQLMEELSESDNPMLLVGETMPNPTPEQIAEVKSNTKYKLKHGTIELNDGEAVLLFALESAERERDESLTREDALRKDASELLISELVYRNGEMNVSFQNQPMTRVLAEWAMESFKAHPDAINYLQIEFGVAGEEHYEMVVRKAFGKMPATLAAENKDRAEAAEKRNAELTASIEKFRGHEKVLAEIASERERQDEKWGVQNHHPAEWLSILGEEFGEVCKAVCEAHFAGYKTTGKWDNYREELIHTAAVAEAMIECHDRDVLVKSAKN